MIEPQPSTSFHSYLLPGERLLWCGQPKQGLTVSSKDALLIPFSLMWGGFAIFWNASVWSMPNAGQGGDWFFRLWGLPFLIAGLYMIVGRFIHDAALRRRLYYAVTDQRILILRGPRLKSLDIARLPKIELSEHGDGTGTIELDGDNSMFTSRRNGFGYWTPALSDAVQFFRITDPRTVYQLIRSHAAA
ncbi:PH domain-containing protein [Novosphingobium flavum]|uniref:PH domain-containing protein n=1 Tax=Novosphingobium flavum TaxID=1778672 RepID=A0A7X1FPN3_9SPHN|nr:PH domain-containing protein [Novosphingobium flavum]MBC2664686.1 PH domain-containing protein [Novosphingobium flavum]